MVRIIRKPMVSFLRLVALTFIVALIGIKLGEAYVIVGYELTVPCPHDFCLFGTSAIAAPEEFRIEKGEPGYYRDYCNTFPEKCR